MSTPSSHTMELPRKVIVGGGVLDSVGDTCRSLGFTGVAGLLTGKRTYEVAGEATIDALKEADFEVCHETVTESTVEAANRLEEKFREIKPNIIVGVGGGKVIDVAKFAASRLEVDYLSVPTAGSHDGIASPQASISKLGKPYSVRTSAPIAIIADLDIIEGSPHKLVASGCGDILAKFTAVRDWWLAHYLKNEYYGEYAADLALMSAKIVSRSAESIGSNSSEGIRLVVEALISCGVAASIAGTSRPSSGSEHLFSHALDLVAPNRALHGEQCGVGAIMMSYLHRMEWRKIRDALKKIGAPTTAAELNVDREFVVEALIRAHSVRPERYTILGEKGLSRETAEKLAKTTGVI